MGKLYFVSVNNEPQVVSIGGNRSITHTIMVWMIVVE